MVTQGVLGLGFLIVVGLILATDAWLLSESGLNESSYKVRHLSMQFSRVFLSVRVESNDAPTLIETQWPVSYFPMPTVVFPHIDVHSLGDHDDCSLVQQAHWSQVDALSRLWVMDIGFPGSTCSPRLFVFDLMRNNAELLRIDCGHHIGANDTHFLTVQMGPKGPGCEHERHIYFILGRVPEILAYDILEQTWHRLSLESNKYENMNQSFPIKPVDFTFGIQGELILSDQDGDLYSTVDRTFGQSSGQQSQHDYRQFRNLVLCYPQIRSCRTMCQTRQHHSRGQRNHISHIEEHSADFLHLQ